MGTLVDISGNGNNGTIVGAVSSEDGMKFNGSSDTISLVGGSVDLGINSTICFRCKPTTLTGNRQILGEGTYSSDWVVHFSSTQVWFRIGTIFDTISHALKLDQFQNFVISRTGDAAILYINGINVGAYSGYGIVIHTLFDTIGSDQNMDTFFSGEIADLKGFNYAFSEQEAIDYHNSFQKLEKRGNFALDFGVGDTIG